MEMFHVSLIMTLVKGVKLQNLRSAVSPDLSPFVLSGMGGG